MVAMNWNAFKYLADLSHVTSLSILLWKMVKKNSCSGVSYQTHFLYLIVYCSRYINSGLFNFPLYNIVIKLFCITATAAVLILMKTSLNGTIERRHDTFRSELVLMICIPLAWFTSSLHSVEWFFWSYSFWVEAFAIMPQLLLLKRTQKIDVLTTDYIFFLALYKVFYLLSWTVRMWTETGRTAILLWVTGLTQAFLYSDFVWVYIRAKLTGADFALPQ